MKQTLSLFTALLLVFSAHSANAVLVDVFAQANSTGGGVGASTGVVLVEGQEFSVSVDSNDLWNAGALPRWSNADGLTGDLFATGSDDSGQAAGTLIGRDFRLYRGIPYGTLVGTIGNDLYEIGTSFVGRAIASGELLLWYWDSNNADNSEFITANVTAQPAPVPAPGAFGLIAAGLMAFLVRRRRTH